MRFIQQLIVLALSLFLLPVSHAAVERIIDYEYDGAGNIVRIISQEQSAPPVITLLTPNFINIGRSVSITATGSGLLGVDVATSATGVSITDIDSRQEDQVIFRINASALATVGTASLTFTTGLGSTASTIAIAAPRPALTTNPNPIAVSPNGTPTIVSLLFTDPRPENETYTVSIGDTSVAATTTSSFTILAGQRQADISLTGLVAGVSSLEIAQQDKFFFYSFPVYVGKSYLELLADFPDMGQRNLFSNAVGVHIQAEDELSPTALLSPPVGVQLNSLSGVLSSSVGVLVDSRSAFFSQPVGVFYGDGARGTLFSIPVGVSVTSLNPVISQAVGVNVSDIMNFAFAPQVQSVLGPLSDEVQPASAAVNMTVNFIVSGFNLNEVLSTTISPADDIVVGAFTVNTEGTQITIPLTINAAATLGNREINLIDTNGTVFTRFGLPLTFVIQ